MYGSFVFITDFVTVFISVQSYYLSLFLPFPCHSLSVYPLQRCYVSGFLFQCHSLSVLLVAFSLSVFNWYILVICLFCNCVNTIVIVCLVFYLISFVCVLRCRFIINVHLSIIVYIDY